MIAGFAAGQASLSSPAAAADAATPAPQDALAEAGAARPDGPARAQPRNAGDRFAALLAAAVPAAPIPALPLATGTEGGVDLAEPADSQPDAAADAALPELLLALIGGTPLAARPATAMPPSPDTGERASRGAGPGAWAVSAPALAPATTVPSEVAPDPAAPLSALPGASPDGAPAGALSDDGRAAALPVAGFAGPPQPQDTPATLAPAAAAATDPALATPPASGADPVPPSAAAETADARTAGVDPASPLTGTAPAAAAARPTPAQAPLALPVDPGTGFDDAFGARIGWMAEQRIGRAELRVTPDHAGPIDVRLQLDGQRVSLEFHSSHAETRQALEASLPRLRDMLGQQGLQLAQADVGQRQAGDGRATTQRPQGPGEHDPGQTDLPPAPLLRARGLLDEYA